MPINQKNLNLNEKRKFSKNFLKWIESDDRAELARKHNVQQDHISSVLRSARYNIDIFNDAIQLMKEKKEAHQKELDLLKQAI